MLTVSTRGGALARARRFCYQPGIVQISEHRAPLPLPAKTNGTVGQGWMPYAAVVAKKATEKKVSVRVFEEMLEKCGFRVTEYKAATSDLNRNLYVAVGADLSSVALLAAAHQWLEQTRHAVKLVPILVSAKRRRPDDGEVEAVPRKYFHEHRGIELRTIVRTDEDDYDAVQVAWNLRVGKEEDEELEWTGVAKGSALDRFLVNWVIYNRVKLWERHPFGAAVLFGTNLDRNLQKLADVMVPDEAEIARELATPDGRRCRNIHELAGYSLEPTGFELAIDDPAHADWKRGRVMKHRPFLAMTSAQVQATGNWLGARPLVDLLPHTPPVSERLDKVQVEEILKLAKRCHVQSRGLRKVAAEFFIETHCRLDYKLGWSTMDAKAACDEALVLAVASLIAFSSAHVADDWLMRPPAAARKAAALILREAPLPPSSLVPLADTGVALLFGSTYDHEQEFGVENAVFSFVPFPDAAPGRWAGHPLATQFPPLMQKHASHFHPPTRCFTGVVFGKWLVQLFTTIERKNCVEAEKLVFWVTHLRPLHSPWWRQIADNFLAYMKTVVHDPALHDAAYPTRPAPSKQDNNTSSSSLNSPP